MCNTMAYGVTMTNIRTHSFLMMDIIAKEIIGGNQLAILVMMRLIGTRVTEDYGHCGFSALLFLAGFKFTENETMKGLKS